MLITTHDDTHTYKETHIKIKHYSKSLCFDTHTHTHTHMQTPIHTCRLTVINNISTVLPPLDLTSQSTRSSPRQSLPAAFVIISSTLASIRNFSVLYVWSAQYTLKISVMNKERMGYS